MIPTWVKHMTKLVYKPKKNQKSKYDLTKVVRRQGSWEVTNGYAAIRVTHESFQGRDIVLDQKMQESILETNMPSLDTVMPTDEPIFEQAISAKNVSKLLQIMNDILKTKNGQECGVVMRCYGRDRPIEFIREKNGTVVYAVHMPMKDVRSNHEKEPQMVTQSFFRKVTDKVRKVVV